jgi:2-isopropylmalate synthase
VDAVFKPIERITGLSVQLTDYQVSSVSVGEDAQGDISVEVEHQGRTYRGRATDTDIILGSAHAFLEAINRVAAQLSTHALKEAV